MNSSYLKKFDYIFSTIEKLKRKEGLEVYDTHIHPFDVMEVVNEQDYVLENENLLAHKEYKKREYSKTIYCKPTFPELLKYNSFSVFLIRNLFRFAPSVIKSSIIDSYRFSGSRRILDEMSLALIDRSVLVPIAPYIETKAIFKHFSDDKRFIFLGSIDIHHDTSYDNTNEQIEHQIQAYNIKGIKLHPNLQGFYPQPSKNTPQIAKKLKKIYEIAAEKKLYLLFHAGVTNYFSKQGYPQGKDENTQDGTCLQSSRCALLENFCTLDGKSEIFEEYDIPIILAHFGSYALNKPNLKLIKVIANKFSNVFFDTSGVSPSLIKRVLKIVGSKKIIFGSDALYNRILYNLKFCFDAINQVNETESLEEKVLNIFGNNFREKVIGF